MMQFVANSRGALIKFMVKKYILIHHNNLECFSCKLIELI